MSNIPDLDTCCVTDCFKLRSAFYDGKAYCRKHYDDVFFVALAFDYSNWVMGSDPPHRFRYMLGRLYTEFSKNVGGSYLSADRIRNRGFAFEKNDSGCCFCITRHLNAWTETKTLRRVVESWQVNINTFNFVLTGTRDWVNGDPD